MNKSGEKGISLVSLGIAIVVILLVTGMLVYNTQNASKADALKKMQNDMGQLNAKVEQYITTYGGIPKAKAYTNINKLQEAGIMDPEDGESYFVIDLEVLENVSLNYGRGFENSKTNAEETDVYIINEKTHIIYYPKGILLDGVTYYRLKE